MKVNTLKEDRRGFTLVELIVVIAILAILAAVAYPVYTGYIAKANEAADQVLLGAVNESFRSALYDVGYNEGTPADANASLLNRRVHQVTVPDVEDFNTTFFKYFAGNEDKEFKVVDALVYDKDGGYFYASLNGGNKILLSNNSSLENKGTKDGITTWEWNNGGETYTIKTKENDIVNFNNSSFSQKMTMEELMGEIGYVANSAAQSLKNSTGRQLTAVLTEDMQNRLDSLGYKVENKDEYLKAAANALVVQAAEQSDIYTLDNIVAYMKKEGNLPYPDIDYKKDGLFSGTAAQGALQYGIIMGFLNSPEGQDAHLSFRGTDSKQFDGTAGEYYRTKIQAAFEGTEPQQATGRIGDLCTALRDCPEYQEYLNSGEGLKDIEGYLGALSMVRDNGDEFIKSGVIAKGYGTGNSDLTEMLTALFGG